MELYHSEKYIHFKDNKLNKIGYTNYDENLYKELCKVSWSKKGNYIYSSKLKQSLHQFVMAYWYGQESLDASKKAGFIVEHHDNNGFNCTIENLSFVPEDINKGKAFTYDKDREKMLPRVAVNFFKDFNTGKYQITVAFNKPIYLKNGDSPIPIGAMYLLYPDDFRRTLRDALAILNELEDHKKIDLSKLQCEKMKLKKPIILATNSEQPFSFDENGSLRVHLDNENVIITKIGPDKDLFQIEKIDE